MTAIVGILNKKAAVMAADSALTIINGDKPRIYNNTTKIFKLSNKYPVGVMLFNSLEFMGVPLDVLIKLYRKQRGDKPFPTLQGYVDNFIDFLSKEPRLKDDKMQDRYLCSEIVTYYKNVKESASSYLESDMENSSSDDNSQLSEEEEKAKLREALMFGINDITRLVNAQSGKSPEFESYKFRNFLKYAKEDIDGLMDLCKEEDLPTDMRDEWEKGLYEYLCSNFFYNGTGLVFVGYGENDLFPALIPIYISGIFDGNLRFCYSAEENEQISNDNESAIVPFAQSDVMMTLMKGISPALREKVDELARETVDQTKEKLLETLKNAGADKSLIDKVRETDLSEVTEKHNDQVQEFIQAEYVNGLVDTVEAFGVEDMADMAESLISITNLQRHITASDETVGGPVDVAVITRDEGFIWLKHHDWMPKVNQRED